MTPAAPDARTDVATGSTERGLTPVQQREILDDGYTLLPGIVAPDLIDRARRAINASLGERGLDPEQLPTLRARSYCPELASTPEILGLLTESPLWSIAESVIAPGELEPVDHAQIALRFPSRTRPARCTRTSTACTPRTTASPRGASATSPR